MDSFFQRVDLSESRAFLFDWSGTVSDDRRSVYAANSRMRANYGLPPNPSFEIWIRGCGASAFHHFRELGVTATEEEVNAHYLRELSAVVAEGTRPEAYEDAAAMFELLATRDCPIAVVSSHPPSHLAEEANRYGLSHRVRAWRGGVENKVTALARLCDEFDVSPADAFYVGDTVYDIRAAKKAGLVAVGITTGYHAHERLAAEDPDAMFPSLTALAKAVCKAI